MASTRFLNLCVLPADPRLEEQQVKLESRYKMYQARANLPLRLVEELRAEGLPVLDAFLSTSIKIRESHTQALPMIHLDPKHKLSMEFEALYNLLTA